MVKIILKPLGATIPGDPKRQLYACYFVSDQKHRLGLTVASSEVWVSESAVFAQAADDDGDAGQEEDQTYNNPRHHQRRHQERRLPSGLPLTPAVWVLPMALVGAHYRGGQKEMEVRFECVCVSVCETKPVYIGRWGTDCKARVFN